MTTTKKLYYKAVRPDLTDFTTGRTTLVLGKWMPDIVGELRDLITPEQFDILTGPWVSVMGRTWEVISRPA